MPVGNGNTGKNCSDFEPGIDFDLDEVADNGDVQQG